EIEVRPMKPFVIWATGVLAAFAALAGVTTATRGTERVFVVVDTSQPMLDVIDRVPAELDRIARREYAEFALATVARRSRSIHGYQSDIDWVNVDGAFDVCSFDDIDSFPEASTADERILITSRDSCDTSELDGWTIIELDR
ncbi:MAG: hypothetical protein WA964_06840, partial [Ilumatobacter sp.]|uniref:hypothetical protein n=1 Tax=Ilumatobacter sp. TaxID=1967498 RepID=UPI003C74B7E3